MDILKLTISRTLELLGKREISCKELIGKLAGSIEEKDKSLKSYISLNEKALDQAAAADERIQKGEGLRLLEGIPVAVKDNICVRGMKATCASRMLENFRPPYDATVIKKLQNEGAIIIGKTNMDEFAFGSSTENSAFFTTRNPHDASRVPGGSSGGSAAAVAADLCSAALGSDTGGSIRQPASFCGVVGMKPTYGSVSRYGLIAFASSLDQIGPLTKDVKDACLIMNVIAGKDAKDSTSADFKHPDYTQFLRQDMKGFKVGIPGEYFGEGIDPMVKEQVEKAVKTAESLGASIENISLPHTGYGIAVYYIVATAEASSNLARFDGVRYGFRTGNYKNLLEMYMNTRGEGFGKEAKRRIMMGTYVLSSGYYEAYYMKATKVRSLIGKDFDDAFGKVDVIFTPTTPEVPFKAGEKENDPLKMYLSDIFTANVNLAGLPSISIPAGSVSSLPVGLQVIAPRMKENLLFEAASAMEHALKNGG